MPLLDGTPFAVQVKTVATTAGQNIFVPLPSGSKRVLFRRITNTNASTSLATSTTTMGVSVSSGGAGAPSGVVIVTAAVGTLTGLTGSTITFDCTIAATAAAVLITPAIPSGLNPITGNPFNTAGVFLNIAGTNNVPATFDTYIECQFMD
jgi:hypothetical protein